MEPVNTSNPQWGALGHLTINKLAARHMSPDIPDFFKASGDRLVQYGGQPDRWKIAGLDRLADSNVPDHHVYGEQLGTRPYPALRSQYMEMLVNQHIGVPGQIAVTVGFLPYRIAETCETLEGDFALWRREVAMHGDSTALALELADDAVRAGGLLGHFVGDASQPLHTTVHHDGWDEKFEPNPGGFTTTPGLHHRFESTYVNKNLNEADIESRLTPALDRSGDPLQIGLDFIAQSRGHVREVYQLDKDGKLDPDHPSAEANALVDERLAAGTQLLSDLWATAWHRSAALVDGIHDPD